MKENHFTPSGKAELGLGSSDWLFETKLDGYRAIAVIDLAAKLESGHAIICPLNPNSGRRRGCQSTRPVIDNFRRGNRSFSTLDRRSRIADETIALSNNRGGTFHNMSREGLTYVLPTHAPARLLDLQHPIKADDLCAWDEKIIWRITHIPGQRSK